MYAHLAGSLQCTSSDHGTPAANSQRRRAGHEGCKGCRAQAAPRPERNPCARGQPECPPLATTKGSRGLLMSSAWRRAFAPPGLRLGAFAAPPLPCWPNSAESAGRWLRARRHSTTAPQPPALLMGRRGKRARQVRPTQTTRAPFPAARSMGSRDSSRTHRPCGCIR